MSLFRNTVWFLKGLKEYTQGGYLTAAKHFKQGDLDVDCTGKEYMITGSNSGLGKTSALEIVKRGGTIHMVCRNAKYAEDAKNEIIHETKNEKVYIQVILPYKFDTKMISLSSINITQFMEAKAYLWRLKETYLSSIDVFVNAGY